jgi:hypothetical protein
MRSRCAAFIITLFCCVVPVPGFAQANAGAKPLSHLEQTPVTAENSYVEAVKKGDAGFLKHTLTDDFWLVAFDGQLYTRQEMLDQFGEGGVDLLAYDMMVVTATDSVAIVTYDLVLRVPPAEDQGPPPRGISTSAPSG